jgi:phenylalanyl-tRNA synthetase alpha chain
LKDVKNAYVSKNGIISKYMRRMKDLPNEEKPKLGKAVNHAKKAFMKAYRDKEEILRKQAIAKKLDEEAVDVTLPGKRLRTGHVHVLNQIIDELTELFIGLGYTVEEGPEVETDEYNFEMLNLPKTHPARDMQDTFYITEETLLRTHTSPVQIRTLLKNKMKKPIKIICPGKVYRRDDDDQTHSHQFTQIEGLVVDEKTSLSDLKGTLLLMARKMFGEERQIRLRPSYFPFTEPSVEVDVSCYKCGGEGCSMCKHTGWIEVLGAGMVNNAVLEAAGYDPDIYQGFAFGVGIERIAILRYGIDDIRSFFTNDLRFNRQFR